MPEMIGNAKINYQFYSGVDGYSDGDIEDELLNLVKNNSDVMEILAAEKRWPILYHLSPVRQNILEWYPFREGAEVLEVGSGCGAITGVLCRKAGQVTCIELSKRRSLININRNKEYANLEIMVGNFNDIKIDRKFDYITLIGVMEYAGYYTSSESPFVSFLENIKKMLKPDGKLLIAIENKFGLKYWAGAREDHTGVYFDGIEGYHATASQVRTFSKDELTKIIRDAGYSAIEYFYPFPDYKFPTQIFSDDYKPKADDLICSRDSFDNSRVHLFDETMVYKNIIDADKFDFFSNSFFVEVGIE